jgi:hypothetical protein
MNEMPIKSITSGVVQDWRWIFHDTNQVCVCQITLFGLSSFKGILCTAENLIVIFFWINFPSFCGEAAIIPDATPKCCSG